MILSFLGLTFASDNSFSKMALFSSGRNTPVETQLVFKMPNSPSFAGLSSELTLAPAFMLLIISRRQHFLYFIKTIFFLCQGFDAEGLLSFLASINTIFSSLFIPTNLLPYPTPLFYTLPSRSTMRRNRNGAVPQKAALAFISTSHPHPTYL